MVEEEKSGGGRGGYKKEGKKKWNERWLATGGLDQQKMYPFN